MLKVLNSLLEESANVLTIVDNMKKPLYQQYVEEREQAHFIECEHGFAIYKIYPDHVYLQDIYVEPEFRQSGIGVRLMDSIILIARKMGMTKLVGSVVPSTPLGNQTLGILLKLNFKLLKSSDDIIYLVKEI
jgi:ribosomal protein S18 acetylase RimI-like enzyme